MHGNSTVLLFISLILFHFILFCILFDNHINHWTTVIHKKQTNKQTNKDRDKERKTERNSFLYMFYYFESQLVLRQSFAWKSSIRVWLVEFALDIIILPLYFRTWQLSAVTWRHFLYAAPLEMDDSLQLADGGLTKNVSWIHIKLFVQIRDQLDNCADTE